MNKELIERLRSFESDHTPEGWPAIKTKEISALIEMIEKLNAEVQEQARLLGISAERELSLLSQLAASQAREAKLREALAQYRTAMDFTRQYVGYEVLPAISGWSWFDADEDAKEALSQPTDDTALRELIKKAGEVMWWRCFDSIDGSIRALPVVTLDDLKGGFGSTGK